MNRVWFLLRDTSPEFIWRVSRILLQCSIPADLHCNEHGYWLHVEDRPNLPLALGGAAMEQLTRHDA